MIESFHLLFLQVLTARAQDWFILKGGANIRYFYGSDRYSNDIDLDFTGRESWRVGDAVDKALTGRALEMLLSRSGFEMAEVTKPKQTETTRRWKLGLRRVALGGPLIRTKIEFSARAGTSDDVLVDRVPDAVVAPYGHMAPLLRHYGETAALEQKIAALALRSETKARDVFDLDLLFRRRGVVADAALDTVHAAAAASRAREIPDASFRSEVLPFLDHDIVELYEPEGTWEHMRDNVAAKLDVVATHVEQSGNARGSRS